MAEMMQRDGALTLVWGVKESFRNYVEAAGGTIEAGAGAARNGDGAFVFPATPEGGVTLGPDGRPQGTARFVGEARFEAHGGMLKVFLADPSLEVTPSGAVLSVADSEARDQRVVLASLDLAAATKDDRSALSIPAKLSRDGWRVLGDHYPPMTPLDSVRLEPVATR